MNNFLQQNLNGLIALCREHKVNKLAAFGSVCTENFSAESDVDLLVNFSNVPLNSYSDNYFDLKENLEKLFHREVDLVEEKTLTNPYFIKVMRKTLLPIAIEYKFSRIH